MLLDVILCAGIALLLLVLLWCLAGRCLLPVRPGAQLIFYLSAAEPALERQVRAVSWLRNSGLFDGTLLLVVPADAAQTLVLAEALSRRYLFVECCRYDDWKHGLRET